MKEVVKTFGTNDNGVVLRGLPFNASEEDITKFFGEGFDIVDNGIFLLKKS